MQNGDASMGGMQHGEKSNNPHEGHSIATQVTTTQAKLTASRDITPKMPVKLLIDFQDSAGNAIANFDTFQQKLMHLIVVSDNLQFFSSFKNSRN